MSLQWRYLVTRQRVVAPGSGHSPALSPARPTAVGPACIPPPPSSALAPLCILAKALLQSQSHTMSLMAEKFPPGLSGDRYVVVSHPTWVCSLLLVGTQEW